MYRVVGFKVADNGVVYAVVAVLKISTNFIKRTKDMNKDTVTKKPQGNAVNFSTNHHSALILYIVMRCGFNKYETFIYIDSETLQS